MKSPEPTGPGPSPAFRVRLPPEELEEILRRVEARLVEPEPAAPVPGPGAAAKSPLADRIGEVRAMRAPFFVLGRPGLSAIAAVLNLPLRFVGRKQHRYNEEVLNLLHELSAKGRETEEKVSALQHDLRAQTERLCSDLRAQAEWTRLLAAKHERLARDWREDHERIAGPPPAPPPPRVLNPAAVEAGRAAGALKANLGCGERPRAGYVNVDFREGPGIDVVADVTNLPFGPGALAEIASSHLVEHFREYTLRMRLLPYWRSLLRPGGALRIVAPDWEAMLARVGDGRMAPADFRRLVLGAQDYPGDDHLAMYTPDELASLLRAAGFEGVRIEARDRMNDICPEMEVVGLLPCGSPS
jgi:predicted SAM-dependent methyltransferase